MFDLFARHLHRNDDPWTNAPHREIEIRFMLGLILKNQEKLMPAIDDLKAAIADLTTALNDNNAEIEALLVRITTPGTSDADVATAVQSIRDLIAVSKTEVDKAKAAVA